MVDEEREREREREGGKGCEREKGYEIERM